jgi:hypothetical protein
MSHLEEIDKTPQLQYRQRSIGGQVENCANLDRERAPLGAKIYWGGPWQTRGWTFFAPLAGHFYVRARDCHEGRYVPKMKQHALENEFLHGESGDL